jgi:hypothetical protein
MSSGPRTPGPRHLAGGAHRDRTPPLPRAAFELDPTEVLPVARVKRSRLAFALSITLAALPILVLDNIPASAGAETSENAGAVLTAPVAPTTAPTVAPTAPPSSVAVAPAPTTTSTPQPTTTSVASVAKVVARQSPPATQAPAPTTTSPPKPRPGDPNDPATWDRLAQCEASGNWSTNTGNGYYGGLQFSLTSWQRFGGTGYPHEASKATQISIGKRLQAADGWGAWPGCARHLGYI